MNKIISIFSFAVVLIAISFALITPTHSQNYFHSASNSCEISNACVKSGSSCNGTFGLSNCNSSSANSNCCGLGLWCVNSTCVIDNMGDHCNSALDCVGGGDLVACQNNTCVQLGLPGDDCSVDTDCYYNMLNVNWSKCSNESSTCTGLAQGASCNPKDYTCGPGLYCPKVKKSNCTAMIPLNGKCNITRGDICADGNICSYNGTCIAPYGGASGAKCASDAECSADLFCNNSACVTPSQWSKVECTNNSDCSNGSLCLCDTFTGEQICIGADTIATLSKPTSYCGSYNQDLLSCLAENNCSYYYYTTLNSETLGENSCPAVNCKSDYKKAAGCGCDTQKDILGNCFADQYCGGFPLWAIIVIAIVGVILVLVVIVVIVMVMRKRRTTYDTIA